MTIKDRRDSFCGKMSVCNNLRQYRIPHTLTRLHTDWPDTKTFAQVFFFNDTATTEIYTTYDPLSLHDALPIWLRRGRLGVQGVAGRPVFVLGDHLHDARQ